ncbi:helix-turn-helix domain-containing protein [Micromonospora sp. NPDC050187]|uniref:helix-turn-helix domain-containing protein n=1 Tax=Micromonospora sp. NPDC050187 TaxID=3364277 RepID=UPI00379EA664
MRSARLRDARDLTRFTQWRVRRRMSQQVFADRIGKSKSWVEKVERGVRALDRFSVIEDIASVLRVDPVVLLGRDALPPAVAADVKGVEGMWAALALHNVPRAGQYAQPAPSPAELGRSVEHAWLTYQHARYPQLLRMLVAANHIAPAEIRSRPVARTVVAELVRGGPVPADVARLATTIGVV